MDRAREIEAAMWSGDVSRLRTLAPCKCCCALHTFDDCPARVWHGCKGQVADDEPSYVDWERAFPEKFKAQKKESHMIGRKDEELFESVTRRLVEMDPRTSFSAVKGGSEALGGLQAKNRELIASDLAWIEDLLKKYTSDPKEDEAKRDEARHGVGVVTKIKGLMGIE